MRETAFSRSEGTDIVVVSPHLDDAVLSAYGLLSPTTTVVTVLAGLPPPGSLSSWDAESGAADSRSRIVERRLEDERALGLSGSRAVQLDFPDRQYVGLGVMPAPTPAQIAHSLRAYLEAASRVFVASALSATSRNPLRRRRRARGSDHRLVRDAVLEVRPDATLYADLPYALTPHRGFALPPDVDRSGRSERRVSLDAETLAEKIEAVRCYETQLAPLIAIFGDFVNPAGLGLEVFWEPSAP